MSILKFQIQSHIKTFQKKSNYLCEYLERFLSNQENSQIEKYLDPNFQYQQEIRMSFEASKNLLKEEEVYKSLLPQIVNNSIIVTSFSLFEYYFRNLANTIRIRWSQEEKNEVEGRKIEDYKSNIYRITGYDFEHLTGYWGTICSIKKIRNLIVHHGSTVISELERTVKKQPDFSHLKNHQKINLSEDTGHFTISDPTLVNDFFEDSNKYLIELYKIFEENNFGKKQS